MGWINLLLSTPAIPSLPCTLVYSICSRGRKCIACPLAAEHLFLLHWGPVSSSHIGPVAKRSTMHFPNTAIIFWNNAWCSFYSADDWIDLDSSSAMQLSTTGRYSADRDRFFSRHHLQNWMASLLIIGEWVPPIWLI